MRSLMMIVALLAGCISSVAYGQSGWSTQTSNTSNALIGVSFYDSNNGWAVGASATIRHTTDGGATWGTQTSPVSQVLRSVFALDASTAVAVGDNGLIIRTTDGGANWTQIASGTTNTFTSVCFANSTTGWIVGGLTTSATIKTSTNGGASWGTQTTTAQGVFRCVGSASSSIVSAVGGTSDNLFQIRARTTNGGTNWTTQVQGTVNGVVYGIAYGTSTDGMMAGAGGLVYKTTDAGSGWTATTSPTSNIIYGVGKKDANSAVVVGTSGEIFRTTDAGANWTTQTGITSSTLFGVSFVDVNAGYAVGQSGTIIKTTTGGVVSSITASKTGDYAGNSIAPGASDVPLLQVNVVNSQGTAFVSTLKAGLVAGCSAVDADFIALKVYNDLDNSGTVSDGDVSLGTTTFSAGIATLNSLTFPVTTSGAKLLFVVDIAPGANQSHTAGIELQDASCMTATNAASTGFPIGNSSISPLPVELISFNATTEGSSARLTWRTATEVNNVGFEVERAMKNEELGIKNWNTLGFVAGRGTAYVPKEYSFIDKNTSAGKQFYRLKQIDRDGAFVYSQEVAVETSGPETFSLSQNYPNPFNPSTVISYQLSVSSEVALKIFDVLGREVATLVKERKGPGAYTVEWNAAGVSSGVYFYTLKAGDFVQARKMLVVK